MQEVKDIVNGIKNHLPKHSLARVKLIENFWESKIIIDHKEDFGSVITITKSFGRWIIKHKSSKDTDVSIEMTITPHPLTNEDTNEIFSFVHNHTMHHNPEDDK